jgi:putative membrane protein
MGRFLVRLVINAIALYAAVALVPGIRPETDNWISYIWLALIFGIINAILRPILVVVGCPFLILTLGLGGLLINTLLFYLAGLIGQSFGVGFSVDGFVPAFLGALIVSIVGFALSSVLRDDRR